MFTVKKNSYLKIERRNNNKYALGKMQDLLMV